MTGYQSKRAAAQDKLAQPAQEPVVRWEFLERNQYKIGSLVTQLIFIAVVIILGVLI
jgi:hypothetical protein